MNFHKWPTAYNWGIIGNTPSSTNSEAQRLGVNLRNQLGVKYNSNGTSATNADATSTLKTNNFSASLSGFNPNDFIQVNNVGDEIIGKRPVYMSGRTSNNEGHAWVCSGYKYDNVLYAALYITREFGDYGSYAYYSGVNKPADKFYYMDWGWNGAYNGWIYCKSATAGSNSFTGNREIIKIRPNK